MDLLQIRCRRAACRNCGLPRSTCWRSGWRSQLNCSAPPPQGSLVVSCKDEKGERRALQPLMVLSGCAEHQKSGNPTPNASSNLDLIGARKDQNRTKLHRERRTGAEAEASVFGSEHLAGAGRRAIVLNERWPRRAESGNAMLKKRRM